MMQSIVAMIVFDYRYGEFDIRYLLCGTFDCISYRAILFTRPLPSCFIFFNKSRKYYSLYSLASWHLLYLRNLEVRLSQCNSKQFFLNSENVVLSLQYVEKGCKISCFVLFHNGRPKWMRKKGYLSCYYKKCFFCKYKHIKGFYPTEEKMVCTSPPKKNIVYFMLKYAICALCKNQILSKVLNESSRKYDKTCK